MDKKKVGITFTHLHPKRLKTGLKWLVERLYEVGED
jgi:hypothetical protein